MLSALCTPYHVQGWLPYTDSICKIFYVQIMSYHQPILNIIYHKTMYFHMFDHHLIPGCQGDQYLQHPLRRRRLSRLCGLWPLPCLAYKQELTGNDQEKGNQGKKNNEKTPRSVQKNLTPRYCRRESLCFSRFLYSALWNLTSPAAHSGTIFLFFLAPQVH